MEVFVLMGEWDYEPHRAIGVYASREEAVDAYLVYTRDHPRDFDYYYVERRVLGAPVDDQTDGDYIG